MRSPQPSKAVYSWGGLCTLWHGNTVSSIIASRLCASISSFPNNSLTSLGFCRCWWVQMIIKLCHHWARSTRSLILDVWFHFPPLLGHEWYCVDPSLRCWFISIHVEKKNVSFSSVSDSAFYELPIDWLKIDACVTILKHNCLFSTNDQFLHVIFFVCFSRNAAFFSRLFPPHCLHTAWELMPEI